jgi:hypothetical protein
MEIHEFFNSISMVRWNHDVVSWNLISQTVVN